jgi:nucleoside-diphosphate-sugar epimerase
MTDRLHVVGVTGATGRLGGRIARRLAEAGVNQRLLVRDPARATAAGASVGRVAFDDREAVVTSLAGVPTRLMVSASETPARVAQDTAFVDAAAEAGVEHLVYVSFYGAASDSTSTRPALTRTATKLRSFSRNAVSFATQRSSLSRHQPVKRGSPLGAAALALAF